MAAAVALDGVMLISVALSGRSLPEFLGIVTALVVLVLPLIMVLTCILSSLPAAFVIWLGEWLRIRSVLFYACAGSAIGTLICALIFRMMFPFSIVFTVAGGMAGIAYWFAAGKYAGEEGDSNPVDGPIKPPPRSGTSPPPCAVRRVLWDH
jgi:hypothetical protein